MKTASRERTIIRYCFLMLLAYFALGHRLFQLQIQQAAALSKSQDALVQRLSYNVGRAQFERGSRGRIYDSRDRLLAGGFDAFDLHMDQIAVSFHRQIDGRVGREYSRGEIADILAALLDDLGIEVDEKQLFERMTEPRKWTEADGTVSRKFVRSRSLVRNLTPDQRKHLSQVFRDSGIRCFYFESGRARSYPEGRLASQIVGFVGKSEKDAARRPKGRAGVERHLDRILAGTNGRFLCEKDASQNEMDVNARWDTRPVDGADVGLTLDVRVQAVVDSALREAFRKHPCRAATGIVIETQTGRILGMQTVPTFDPNDLGSKDFNMASTRCRAVQDSYVPGSTFKPFVVAKAREWGLVNWGDTFDTEQGQAVIQTTRGKRIVHDSSPHGVMSVREIIVKSSNIGMAKIGIQRMGVDRLWQMLDEFEFMTPTGVCIPAEAAGYQPSLAEAKRKPSSGPVSIPFGHEIRLSPLAMAARFSVFGTGGVYKEPVLVDWVGNGDDRTYNHRAPSRLLPEWAANEVRDVLGEAVTDGTGKALRNLSWETGAKTGTAQILGVKGLHGAYSSSMVAIAPLRDTKITVLVVLYGLKGGAYYASVVAAPAVSKIIEETLPLLGVARDHARGDGR